MIGDNRVLSGARQYFMSCDLYQSFQSFVIILVILVSLYIYILSDLRCLYTDGSSVLLESGIFFLIAITFRKSLGAARVSCKEWHFYRRAGLMLE